MTPPATPPDCASAGTAGLYLAGALDRAESETYLRHVAGCAACAAELEETRAAVAALDTAALEEVAPSSPPARVRERILAAAKADTSGTRRGTGAAGKTTSGARERATTGDTTSAGGRRGATAGGTTSGEARAASPGASHDGDPSGRDDIQTWRRWESVAGEAVAPGLHTLRAGEEGWEPTAVPGVAVRPLSVDPVRRYVTMLVRMEPGSSYPPHRHAGLEECFVISGDLEVAGTVMGPGDYQRAEEGSRHGVQSTENGCTLLIVSSQDDELLPVG